LRDYVKVKGGPEALLKRNQEVEASFHVLSQGAWPISGQVKGVKIPPMIEDIQKDFEHYYKSRHNGKMLTFCTQMATALIFAKFTPTAKANQVKQLEVSGLQALVLLAFNEQAVYTYEELRIKTGLTEQELNIQLISLACLEHKIILAKTPEKPAEIEAEGDSGQGETPGKEDNQTPKLQKTTSKISKSKTGIKKTITKEDVFRVNDKFRSQLKRITINSIQKKESRKESEGVIQKVLIDRKFMIDAAIVKTMKANREIKHTDLVQQVISLVRFPLEVA